MPTSKRVFPIIARVLFLGLFSAASPVAGPDATESVSYQRETRPSSAGETEQDTIRVATFNVALNRKEPGGLAHDLASPSDLQAKGVAEIIQRVRPDIVLLNEFDYEEDGDALRDFQEHYLAKGQHGTEGIRYGYVFAAPSNTGVPSGLDLNRNGNISDPEDALGYGRFPGQYGMALLSRFPIQTDAVRTFQKFRWKDMPSNQIPPDYYTGDALEILPLSSKSHWDVPVVVGDMTLHLLCSHPTPPVFDGDEDRNGRRNHDEIRFWADYISGDPAAYIRDDKGVAGGFQEEARFIILGDQNADPDEGDARDAIQQLLGHAGIAELSAPTRRPPAPDGEDPDDTASWGMRADYVLPSKFGVDVLDSGVFWPTVGHPLHRLVASPSASSDHRMVWLDLVLTK